MAALSVLVGMLAAFGLGCAVLLVLLMWVVSSDQRTDQAVGWIEWWRDQRGKS